MVTLDIINENLIKILTNNGIELIEPIPVLSYSEKTKQKWKGHSVLNTASKLNIFTLTHYNKLIYIDADCVFYKNCDNLFNYPDGSMLKLQEDVGGCSTLFVIEPKYHEEAKYFRSILKYNDCFDGDLLENLFFIVKHDKRYQIPEKIFQFIYGTKSNEISKDTKILHLRHDNPLWEKIDDIENTDVDEGTLYYYSLLKNLIF